MAEEEDFKVYQDSLPEGKFLPVVQHALVPSVLPVFGVADGSFENAEKRAKELLTTKPLMFLQAWVLSRDTVTEITL